jgi:hypothetical protein
MICLPDSLAGWGTPAFNETFKQEVAQLGASALPLQEGLALSSHVADSPFSVMVISATEGPVSIHVKAGIVYSGIIAGCSCADDPTPISEQTEYCEVMFEINKLTADTTAALVNA